jgi:hypothetical protein
MTKLCRISTVSTGLLLAVLGVLAAAPAAFAKPAVDSGPAAPAPTYIVSQAGMTGWQVALIAIGAALAAVALTAIVVRVRFRTHLQSVAG